jgi:hypothetical protein
MARADRNLTLTLAVALAGACAAAAYGAMLAIEDAAISLLLGGLLFVSILSLCRPPPDGTARRSRGRAGRPKV